MRVSALIIAILASPAFAQEGPACGMVDELPVVDAQAVGPVYTYRLNYVHSLTNSSKNETQIGVDRAFAMFDPYNVTFKRVDEGPADMYVHTYDVPNNQGGVAVPPGKQGGAYPWHGAYLDSGNDRHFSARIVQTITIHEILHAYFGFGHSANRDCVMHINASQVEFCPAEHDYFVGKWGLKTQPEPEPPPVPEPPPIPEPKTPRHNAENPMDVTGDGVVNYADLTHALWFLDLVLKYPHAYDQAFRSPRWQGYYAKWKPDVNNDGSITVTDIKLIHLHLMGSQ